MTDTTSKWPIIHPGPIGFRINGPMISAQGDAVEDASGKERLYCVHMGTEPKTKRKRRWLVADQPNAADNVYVEGGHGSQGFGGATLTFKLMDGTYLSLKGPWKGNAEQMYLETGVDVRNTYTTFGIIALRRETGKGFDDDSFYDILHLDAVPKLGIYDRIEDLATTMCMDLKTKVWYSMRSLGGGHASWKDPEGVLKARVRKANRCVAALEKKS
jgi:hypothetical protein